MNHYKSENTQAHRVPKHDQDPSEEMIDWLSTCPHDWSGDECGITMACGAGGADVEAVSGDWLVESHGQWFVLKKDCVDAIGHIAGMMCLDNFSCLSVEGSFLVLHIGSSSAVGQE